jgi:hypothetical protein
LTYESDEIFASGCGSFIIEGSENEIYPVFFIYQVAKG